MGSHMQSTCSGIGEMNVGVWEGEGRWVEGKGWRRRRELYKDTHIINEKREKEESNGEGLGFFLFCPFSSCNWVQSHAHLFGKWTPILASSSSSPSSPHFSLSLSLSVVSSWWWWEYILSNFICTTSHASLNIGLVGLLACYIDCPLYYSKKRKKKKLNIYTPIRVLGFRGGILQYDIVDINPRRGWSLDTHYINGPIQCTQFNFPIFFFFLFCLSRKLGFRVL